MPQVVIVGKRLLPHTGCGVVKHFGDSFSKIIKPDHCKIGKQSALPIPLEKDTSIE
jgi:hypothetical protein